MPVGSATRSGFRPRFRTPRAVAKCPLTQVGFRSQMPFLDSVSDSSPGLGTQWGKIAMAEGV